MNSEANAENQFIESLLNEGDEENAESADASTAEALLADVDEDGSTIVKNEENDFTIVLPESIDQDNIQSLHEELIGAPWEKAEVITVDAEDLEDIDFLGLQLLSAVKTKAQGQSAKFKIENVPIEMFEAANEMGMCEALGI